MTRRTRLEVSPLEDRLTPVLGSFDVPYVADPDDLITSALANVDLSGVVDYADGCTGSLLDRGAIVVGSRHILVAAHCVPEIGDVVTFYRRLPDGNLDQVRIPVIDTWIHPTYTGNVGDSVGDIALVTLAAVAPFGAKDYRMYTAAEAAASSEVGKPFIIAGYGLSGTGTTGQAGPPGTGELELQRMTVNATGGSYRVVRPDTGQQSAVLQWNATAAQIQTALAGIGLNPLVNQVTVGPFAPTASSRTFEVLVGLFANLPRMSFVSNPVDPLVNGGNFGTVGFTTLVNGITNPEYQRVTVNATGGSFRLEYGGQLTSPIVFNPADPVGTAARIQAALEALNAPGPGPGEVTVRAVLTGMNQGTYQVSFDDIGFDIPLMTIDPTALTGATTSPAAKVTTIIDGGRRALRTGTNEYDGVNLGTLRSTFEPDGTDEREGQGDSGSAGFILTADGSLAIASVVSYAVGFQFGSQVFDTRVSKYAADVLAQAGLPGYTLTLDMQYQFTGNDGTGDTITVKQVLDQGKQVIQLWVKETGEAGDGKLYYQDVVTGIDSIRLLGTADDDTFIIDPSVTKAVSVDGGFGNDTIIGPNIATAWTITGNGKGMADTATIDFDFQNIENLTGGNNSDTFRFGTGGSISGSLDGGAGADTIDYSLRSASSVRFTGPGAVDGFAGTTVAVGGGFTNINGYTGSQFGGSDVMFTPDTGGTFAHTGGGGVYTNSATGQTIAYASIDRLVGGAGADTFNVRSTNATLALDGGAGDDVFNFAGDAPGNAADRGPIGGTLLVSGGAGSDFFRINGTAANEDVTARVVGNQAGDLVGFGQVVTFDTLEQFLFDGRGGNNTFTVLDFSNTALGTPTDPGSGIVYSPSGPTGGNARINGVTVGATGVAGGFTVNGDPAGTGGRDVLLVVGTSAAGLVSSYGESVVGDGRDTITVTDTGVTFLSATAGPLLPVTFGFTSGAQTFSTLYVAGGNERGNEGDTFVVTTTTTFNLVVDGMLPSPSARPGDRVVVTAPGGGDPQLVNDSTLGPPQTRVTARNDGSSVGIVGAESGVPAVPGAGMIAVATDAGPVSTVRVFDRATGELRYEVVPFDGFTAGLKVASGDVNGDGIADLVVGAGPGGGPRVAVYDGLSGGLLYDFFGYEESFRGGVTVAVGDVDLDGFGDLILGTGVGGGPRVRVVSGRDLSPIKDAFAYEADFRGGVTVAAGDVNGDGVPDLITSTGTGGGPRVVVLDGRTLAQLASFFVFDQNSRDGFFAASGDVNGDGFADIVAGSGAGGPNRVRVFSGFNRALINDFYVNDPFNPTTPGATPGAGVRVAVADANGDGIGDVITGLGPGGDAVVRTYQLTGVLPPTNALFPTLQEIRRQDAFDIGFNSGVFVGASD